MKSDRTQKFLEAGCALLEEAKHRLSQDRQIIGSGMQVQLILLEFAVTRFSMGLQEARIGGQLHESLWIDAGCALLDGLLSQNRGPMTRELDGIEPLLLF